MFGYNPQVSVDRINSQIAELEKLKNQIPQLQPITQNFQLATNNGIKFANSIDEVKNEYVSIDTPYFSKDMAVLWLKKASGDVKTYELNEIVEKDEKDLKIEFLMAEIEELKKVKNNESNVDSNESIKNEKSSTSKKDTRTNE